MKIEVEVPDRLGKWLYREPPARGSRSGPPNGQGMAPDARNRSEFDRSLRQKVPFVGQNASRGGPRSCRGEWPNFDEVVGNGRKVASWKALVELYKPPSVDAFRSRPSSRRGGYEAKTLALHGAASRNLRRILTGMMCSRKRSGFETWTLHRNWHRRMEGRKLKAARLMSGTLEACRRDRLAAALRKWRRAAILCDTAGVDETMAAITSSPPALCSVVASLGDDTLGATLALAVEIQRVKSADLAAIRGNFESEHTRLVGELHTSIDRAIKGVRDETAWFRAGIEGRVDSCSEELPRVQARLDELCGQSEATRAELERVEMAHRDRLEESSAGQSLHDGRLNDIEERMTASDARPNSLADGRMLPVLPVGLHLGMSKELAVFIPASCPTWHRARRWRRCKTWRGTVARLGPGVDFVFAEEGGEKGVASVTAVAGLRTCAKWTDRDR
ncbi:hypothetical protein THAOC_17789 [Thalassiosira oceanica]|uniref:Uncharacterized protein n=1 Tax=Thalassiosira oceanica TaxID=159749 RepID=K0S9W6_THAOC|nr:hypothetical protein THAOC_17789 [Thalassiosira oceanica]|eukprot:EJK61679.1 hypothetical protein THAOC_17789 [Thalassiosira oceanica]